MDRGTTPPRAIALTLCGSAGAQAEAPVSVAVIPEVKLFADACLTNPGDLAAAIAAFEAFGLTYRDDPAAESIGMYGFYRDEVNALFLSGGHNRTRRPTARGRRPDLLCRFVSGGTLGHCPGRVS